MASTTTTAMFSPPRREKARDHDSHGSQTSHTSHNSHNSHTNPHNHNHDHDHDNDHLPHGDCRYILLHPDANGLRCACVAFTLNRALPGSTCDCGHQACYHETAPGAVSLSRPAMGALQDRLAELERALDREQRAGRGGLADRLARLEETLDQTHSETEAALKNLHRGVSGLWQHVGLLEKRTPVFEDHLEGVADEVQRLRTRLEEVDDAAMRVEDRVDVIETTLDLSPDAFCISNSNPNSNSNSRRRKASTPPSELVSPAFFPHPQRQTTNITNITNATNTMNAANTTSTPSHINTTNPTTRHVHHHQQPPSSSSSPTEHPPHLPSLTLYAPPLPPPPPHPSPSWTVHVSLLPTLTQPFPFEKDTTAYKRCLSRGLHRILVIPSPTSAAVTSTITRTFASVLHGRPWRPLVARLCDAKNLRGLPMLRQLDPRLWSADWDRAFLAEHCAVVDGAGKVLDLYVALVGEGLGWEELRRVKVLLPGLEDAWAWDPLLDGPRERTGPGASAGTLVEGDASGAMMRPTWSAALLAPPLLLPPAPPSAPTSAPSLSNPNPSPSSSSSSSPPHGAKRPAAEISRSGSGSLRERERDGSDVEGRGSGSGSVSGGNGGGNSARRSRRVCTPGAVEVVGRRAEAV